MTTSEHEDEYIWEVHEAWVCAGIEHCPLPRGVHHRGEMGWTHLTDTIYGTEVRVTYRVGVLAPPREPWDAPVDPVMRSSRA